MEREAADLHAATAFEYSLNPMLTVDEQWRCVDANTAACLLLRRSREQILEMTTRDLVPAEAYERSDRVREELGTSGTSTGYFELQMPDGERVMTEYVATSSLTPGRFMVIFMPECVSRSPSATVPSERAQARLTEREREVLARVAMGETGQTIARELNISSFTVEDHVRNTLGKLGAKNRPHAIMLALQRGELQMSISPHTNSVTNPATATTEVPDSRADR